MKSLTLLFAFVLALLSGQTVAATGNGPVILVYGDSLSAEYGIARGSGWVALLSERIRKEKLPHRVVNASISGETTAGGLARLAATLKKQQPQVFVLALGANDGLRGLPVAQTRKNLEAMLTMAQEAGAQPVLLGIRIPPNYGPDYTRAFDRLFADIGHERNLPVLPFLLQGIAENPALFQADTIHPNERAQPRILSNVWPVLSPVLSAAAPSASSAGPQTAASGPSARAVLPAASPRP